MMHCGPIQYINEAKKWRHVERLRTNKNLVASCSKSSLPLSRSGVFEESFSPSSSFFSNLGVMSTPLRRAASSSAASPRLSARL